MVPPALQLVERITPFTRALHVAQPEAVETLTLALQHGLVEYEAANRNEVWNVTARLWPTSGQFTRSDREGRPGFGQDCYASSLLVSGDRSGILRMVELGNAHVVVLISLVPYLRAGHELSVHALADVLLEEAERVINLDLPAADNIHVLLRARHESASGTNSTSADTL